MPTDIINYWYSERIRKQWFRSTPELDEEIQLSYQTLWQSAAEGKLKTWQDSAIGCLALVIVLDQFPLNMFRGQAKSFATESDAIAISHHAVAQGFDLQLPKQQLAFLYMPLMHSENLADQDQAVMLFKNAGLDSNHRFAKHHQSIIERFSRFPHRNAILGRENTAAEEDYLASPQAFTG